MTATYVPGKGLYVTVPGLTVKLSDEWSVQVIENYLRELCEFYC